MRHADDGLLNAWLDGGLPRADADALREHLALCADCRNRADEATLIREKAEAILAGGEPPLSDFPPFEAVLRRAQAADPLGVPGPVRAPQTSFRRLAWAASIALAITGGWWAHAVLRPVDQAPPAPGPAAGKVASPGGAAAVTSPLAEAAAPPRAQVPSAGAGVLPAAPFADASPVPSAAARTSTGKRASAPQPPVATAARPLALSGAPGRDKAEAPAEPELAAAAPPRAVPTPFTPTTSSRQLQLAAGHVLAEVRKPAEPQVTQVPAAVLEQARAGAVAPAAVAARAPAAAVDTTGRVAELYKDALEPRRRSDYRTLMAQDVSSQPTFTPYTVAPELNNREEVRAALVRFYPPDLRARGVGGTVSVWLYVNEVGIPARVQVRKSSGFAALDEAALQVCGTMRFTPARNRDAVVGVWVTLPVIFKTDG